jgi:hypothetical protein
VITLGGGYSNPIELTARAHANTFRLAMEVFGLGREIQLRRDQLPGQCSDKLQA